jgi:hypothetical protein
MALHIVHILFTTVKHCNINKIMNFHLSVLKNIQNIVKLIFMHKGN